MEDILVDDIRVPIEDTPAVWPEFLEIPVPVREPPRDAGPPTIELVRLVRVAALLCRLFLDAEVLPKEGIGDLDRVEVLVPLGTTSFPPSSAFASDLLLTLHTEGILLPLAMAVVGRAGAMDDFFAGPNAAGRVLTFVGRGTCLVGAFGGVVLGILPEATGAGTFPRFHTL